MDHGDGRETIEECVGQNTREHLSRFEVSAMRGDLFLNDAGFRGDLGTVNTVVNINHDRPMTQRFRRMIRWYVRAFRYQIGEVAGSRTPDAGHKDDHKQLDGW